MIRETYNALRRYGKPIIPALQAYELGNAQDGVREAARVAVEEFGAPGVSIYRWGDTLTDDYFPSISQIRVPAAPVPAQPPVNRNPVRDTFEYTCAQVLDAFRIVSQYLERSLNELLEAAELTDLDQRLNEQYFGFAIEDLPGLEPDVRTLLATALNGRPLPQKPTPPSEDTYEFTCKQVRDAFLEVADALDRDPQAMMANAGLSDLDQRLGEKYRGLAIIDLPNLSPFVKMLIDTRINSRPLPKRQSGRVAGKLTNRQVIEVFRNAARALGQENNHLNWIAVSGLERIRANGTLNEKYQGPDLGDLQNLSTEMRLALCWQSSSYRRKPALACLSPGSAKWG
jgi:hypothetical protein